MKTVQQQQSQRVKRLIRYLIADGFAQNQRDFAEKFGYTESSFSQVLNGKTAVSRPFLKKLYETYPEISPDWLENGEGDMFKTTTTGSGNIVQAGIVNGNNHQVNSSCEVSRLVSIIEAKDRQIDKLIELLSKKDK